MIPGVSTRGVSVCPLYIKPDVDLNCFFHQNLQSLGPFHRNLPFNFLLQSLIEHGGVCIIFPVQLGFESLEQRIVLGH